MESLHSLLEKNVLDQRRVWESREQLHLAVTTWTKVALRRSPGSDGVEQ